MLGQTPRSLPLTRPGAPQLLSAYDRPHPPLERVLCDNGNEFKGKRFHQTVERLGARTTHIHAVRPQTNGHVEALHKTILDECWRPAFARHLYPRYSGLQRELKRYLAYYNYDGVHDGRLTRGRIPADIVYGAARWRRDESNLSAHLGGRPR